MVIKNQRGVLSPRRLPTRWWRADKKMLRRHPQIKDVVGNIWGVCGGELTIFSPTTGWFICNSCFTTFVELLNEGMVERAFVQGPTSCPQINSVCTTCVLSQGGLKKGFSG